jgi:hypothetical protein
VERREETWERRDCFLAWRVVREDWREARWVALDCSEASRECFWAMSEERLTLDVEIRELVVAKRSDLCCFSFNLLISLSFFVRLEVFCERQDVVSSFLCESWVSFSKVLRMDCLDSMSASKDSIFERTLFFFSLKSLISWFFVLIFLGVL